MSGNKAVEHKEVAAARRRIILDVLQLETGFLSVNAVVERLRARGDWPRAKWSYARNEPYYTGVRQHLMAMRQDGTVEQGQNGWWRAAPEAQLRKRAQEALALKAQGLNGVQIATHMGISRSLAYGLINDPSGAKERERKRAYCPGCGAKKDKRHAACANCTAKKAEALLPEDSEFFLEVAARAEASSGLEVLFGVTPDLDRVVRMGTGRGWTEYVLPPHETWHQAIVACGLVEDAAAR